MMCFSDVFPSSLQRYKNCIQDILIPLLSLVNVFTYAEKGQRSGGIFKTVKFLFYTWT